jgi:ABC-type antimicrobial peptide transport system permease subunit
MSGRDSFILEIIYFAVGCAALGIVFAFILVFACQYFGIDIYKHLWLLLIPLILSISLNILAIELYGRYRSKKRNQ